MAASKRSALAWMTSFTSSAMSGAGAPVLGCTCANSAAQFLAKLFSVHLCRSLTAMRAARMDQSGWYVLL
jgi:hypothetical protein